MQDWPVTVVPNAIDTDQWQPIDKRLSRQLLQLPQDCPLLLFGAMGGGNDPRKGIDLLFAALNQLRHEAYFPDLQLVVFGQLSPQFPPDLGFPIHYTGHLFDDVSLSSIAADLFVIPSRQDNLPNTGVEAQSCGVPVLRLIQVVSQTSSKTALPVLSLSHSRPHLLHLQLPGFRG